MNSHSLIAIAVTITWIPVVLYGFIQLPPQQAVVVNFIVAWLYLPVRNFLLPGIPDITDTLFDYDVVSPQSRTSGCAGSALDRELRAKLKHLYRVF
jgi:hypothetical protein